MKRILSLLLVTCLLISCSVVVLADGGHSTKVRYVGTGTSEWELEVPIQLAPGESGDVILTGTWDSNTYVEVTADETVTLSNNIDSSTKTLNITFNKITQDGNMDSSILVTEPINVSNITGGIFGTWEGIFNYYVVVDNYVHTGDIGGIEEVELFPINIQIDSDITKTYDLGIEDSMMWYQYIDSLPNNDGSFTYIDGYIVYTDIETGRKYNLKYNYDDEYLVDIGAFIQSDYVAIPIVDYFAIEDELYMYEVGMTWGEWLESDNNTENYAVVDLSQSPVYNYDGKVITKDSLGSTMLYALKYNNEIVEIDDIIKNDLAYDTTIFIQ